MTATIRMVRPGQQGPRVVRVRLSVEEDQVARVRPDDRAVPFDCLDVRCGPDHARRRARRPPRRVIGAEEQPGQRIGVDVAFKPHRGSALNVQDDAVSVVDGRRDGLIAYRPGQVEETASVNLYNQGRVRRRSLACSRPRGMWRTSADSRDKTGVRGKSLKSAPAAAAAISCCQSPGSCLVKSNVVQRNPGVTKFVLSRDLACALADCAGRCGITAARSGRRTARPRRSRLVPRATACAQGGGRLQSAGGHPAPAARSGLWRGKRSDRGPLR